MSSRFSHSIGQPDKTNIMSTDHLKHVQLEYQLYLDTWITSKYIRTFTHRTTLYTQHIRLTYRKRGETQREREGGEGRKGLCCFVAVVLWQKCPLFPWRLSCFAECSFGKSLRCFNASKVTSTITHLVFDNMNTINMGGIIEQRIHTKYQGEMRNRGVAIETDFLVFD